jgi:hypothetical protein
MALKAGTVADFGNSMAEAIEQALKTEYRNVKGEDMPDAPAEDRRLLLVAIAQGITRYLKSNTDAWRISVEATLVNASDSEGTGKVDDLATTGVLHG